MEAASSSINRMFGTFYLNFLENYVALDHKQAVNFHHFIKIVLFFSTSNDDSVAKPLLLRHIHGKTNTIFALEIWRYTMY